MRFWTFREFRFSTYCPGMRVLLLLAFGLSVLIRNQGEAKAPLNPASRMALPCTHLDRQLHLCDCFLIVHLPIVEGGKLFWPWFWASLKMARPGPVLKLAIYSRLLVLSLFVFWGLLASPYDTSAAINPPCLGATLNNESSVRWKNLGAAIEKTVVCDAVYYVRIAECGYEFEQTHAFFPLFPLCIRFLANNVFTRLVPLIGNRAVLAICGYLISNVAFAFAALYLNKLTVYVVEDEDLAWRALCLFCFNPASAFYSAIYSESLFALCSFAGLWQFVTGRTWAATLAFSLSCGVRSNGVSHAGFFLVQAMHWATRQGTPVVTVIKAIFHSLVTVAPLLAFQGYGYSRHCGVPGRPWCSATIPYLYGFVQSHYWNVGFLRYFRVQRIPNFLLASPILALAVVAITVYGSSQPRLFFLLGFDSSLSQWRKLALLTDSMIVEEQENKDALTRVQERRGCKASLGGFYSPAAVCFLVQMVVMVFVATCIMHVQVATRFLSVSPPVYWYAAHAMKSVNSLLIRRIIWTYFLSFIGLGSLLFVNFYPFT